MEEKTDVNIELDELKRIRKEFQEQLEEDENSLTQRIREMTDNYSQIRGNGRLRIMIEESMQFMHFHQRRVSDLGSEYVQTLNRRIKQLESERDEALFRKTEEQKKLNERGEGG